MNQTDESCPDGGMENPQYTFATPTFITGVSSLAVYRHIQNCCILLFTIFLMCNGAKRPI